MHNIEHPQDRWRDPAWIEPPGRRPHKTVPTIRTNGLAKRLHLGELFAGREYRLPEIADRFWSKVDTYDDDDCWVWSHRLGSGGYGQVKFRLRGRDVVLVAHRFAYVLEHPDQAIPDGMQVKRSCGEKLCVNPAHLYLADRRGWPLSSAGNALTRFEDRLP
jgi:hypothetical protein